MTEYEQYLQNFNRENSASVKTPEEDTYEEYLQNFRDEARQTSPNTPATPEQRQGLIDQQAIDAEALRTGPGTQTELGANMPVALGAADRFANATSLGWGDEIGAGVNAGLDQLLGMTPPDETLAQTYALRKGMITDRQEGFRKANPMVSLGVDIAGSIPATIATGGIVNPVAAQTILGGVAGMGAGEGLEDSLRSGLTTAGTALAFSSIGRVMQKPGTDRVVQATADAAKKAEQKLLTTRSLINLEKKAAKKAGKAFSRDLKARSAAVASELSKTSRAIGQAAMPNIDIAGSAISPISRSVNAVKGLTGGVDLPLAATLGTAARVPDLGEVIDDTLQDSLFGGNEL